jgi:dihydrofolate reductase
LIALIYAQSENGVIGRDNDLPWHLPEDLKHFKRLTTGHTIVMGRKTFDSIGRALPNRRSVIMTRQPDFAAEGCDVVGSWEEALEATRNEPLVFVIGGAGVFQVAMPQAERVHRTMVHATIPGDVVLEDLNPAEWDLVSSEEFEADERHAHNLSFQILDRIKR